MSAPDPRPSDRLDLEAAREISPREILDGAWRWLRPGLALGLAAVATLAVTRIPDAPGPLDLPAAQAPEAAWEALRADLVLGPAWKAQGVGEILEPPPSLRASHAAARGAIRSVLQGQDSASGPALTFREWGRSEVRMGLWDAPAFGTWAQGIAALDRELASALAAAETRMTDAGLRASLAGPLSRRLALDLVLEARLVSPGQQGRAAPEDLVPDGTEPEFVRAVQAEMRERLAPLLLAVITPEIRGPEMALASPLAGPLVAPDTPAVP